MRLRTAAPWPRVYAQHVVTREIFEVDRGEQAGAEQSLFGLALDFGPTWVVWAERKRVPGKLENPEGHR